MKNKLYDGDYRQLTLDFNREFFCPYEYDEIYNIEDSLDKKYDLIFNVSNGEKIYGIVDKKDCNKLYVIFDESSFCDKFEGEGRHIEYAIFDVEYKPILKNFCTACLLEGQKLGFEK